MWKPVTEQITSADTETSFLARIRTQYVLRFARFAQYVMLVAAPIAFFCYPGNARLGVAVSILAGGIASELLIWAETS